MELLNCINKPIAVLSIAGPYRTGKSYFLSRVMGKVGTFEVGHTTNSQTIGIWMSTSVLECEDYCILLLDTEGIEVVHNEGSYDAKLLVVTLILSSYFVYNTCGVPNRAILEKMRFDS